jgi:hypothetical protein
LAWKYEASYHRTVDRTPRHISGLEPLRNVLRAVHVPRVTVNSTHLLRPRAIARGHQAAKQRLVAFHHARRAPHLDAAPVRVVDQEEVRLRVLFEIALRDVLTVAGKVAKAIVCSSSTRRKPAGPPRCWM